MDSEPYGDSKPHGIATALTSVAKTGEPNGGVPPASALVGDGGWRRLQDEAYYSFFCRADRHGWGASMRYKKRPPSSVDSIFLLLHCHAFLSPRSSYRLSTTHPRSVKEISFWVAMAWHDFRKAQ